MLERKLQDVDFKAVVALPPGLDYNEWLASHSMFYCVMIIMLLLYQNYAINVSLFIAAIAFFEHVNLVYGTVSEFCTMSGCPDMSGPGYRTYMWFDDKGKKTRVPAPQYIDYVMTFIQKTVSDENIFPTKYGKRKSKLLPPKRSYYKISICCMVSANEFPSSFESIVRKILRLMFHVLAHVYHCHFREVVLLNLHAQLNCVFAHFTTFNHTFQLIEPKETEILHDLVMALQILSQSVSIDFRIKKL